MQELLGRKRLAGLVFSLVLLFSWILGGLALRERLDIVAVVGGLVGVFCVYLAKKLRKQLVYPVGFRWFALFIVIFWISLLWSNDHGLTSRHLIVYGGGGLLWLGLFNLKDKIKLRVDNLIVLLSVLYLIVFALQRFFGITFHRIGFSSLVYQASTFKNHNHLGDLWALVVLIGLNWFLQRKRFLDLGLVAMGVGVSFISLSRSSFVALAAGAGYLFWQKGWFEKHRWLSNVSILVVAFLFILVGTQKSVLLSRPYYVQAVAGIVDNPIGVGIGSFGEISDNPKYHILGLSGYSSIVHNIILEVFVGLGVFGMLFIVWLWKVIKSMVVRLKEGQVLYASIFVAIFVNFLFDTTYFVPTMVWIWFAVLAMAQKRGEKGNVFLGIFVGYLVLLLVAVSVVVFARFFSVIPGL